MLRIRLYRVGKRNAPLYRVVISEHSRAVQGNYLEALGSYNPHTKSISVNKDRLLYWLDHGAQPSEIIAKLLVKENFKHKLIVLPDYSRKPKKASKKQKTDDGKQKTEATISETVSENSNANATTDQTDRTEVEVVSEDKNSIDAPAETQAKAITDEAGSNPQSDNQSEKTE